MEYLEINKHSIPRDIVTMQADRYSRKKRVRVGKK